ncbi:MAG: Holliday junction resolvase RuvX [Bacteroidia bacterium]|nr:Holliday junction resolvase RuvX [Bacteroidia bacterium]
MSEGRILALDYGEKRTGMAVTDPLQMIASGMGTVPTQDLIKTLHAYVSEEAVTIFVVGEPKQRDNTPSDIEAEILKFIRKLEQEFPGIRIERQDERYTSKLAMHSLVESGVKKKKRQDKALLDEVSATLILQAYLDRTKTK